MSFETDELGKQHHADYKQLKATKTQILAQIPNWLSVLQNLHGQVSASKQAELMAMHDEVKNMVKTEFNLTEV